jgi:subtilase family serine protease
MDLAADPHVRWRWQRGVVAGVAGVCLLVGIGAAYSTSDEAAASAGPASSSAADCDSVTTCYTPRQLEAAYGVLPLLARGVNGRGETVVLPELAEPQFPLPTSDMRKDLAAFDKQFELPAARLRVVTSLAPSASPWLANGEEVLDTEMVHTVAPGASIVEVPLAATSLNNPASADRDDAAEGSPES